MRVGACAHAERVKGLRALLDLNAAAMKRTSTTTRAIDKAIGAISTGRNYFRGERSVTMYVVKACPSGGNASTTTTTEPSVLVTSTSLIHTPAVRGGWTD